MLALISHTDKHHKEAALLIDKFGGEIYLSPYTLTELDLLIQSDLIAISSRGTFYSALSSLLEYRNVKILSPRPAYHAKAFDLRHRHKQLTYFDSLHAAVGITEEIELISYDRTYAGITGLKHRYPTKYSEKA